MAKKQLKKTEVNTTAITPAVGFWERSENNIYWQLFIIILFPSLIYFKVINFEFVGFDDKVIITDHYNIISSFKNIGEAFKRDAFLSVHGDSFYRPVQTISFMLDAMVSGKAPWMYHFTNLIIHLLTCIALYFFLKQLNFRNYIAFICTLIFSVHPLFASAVSWVPARGDLLIALFALLLFISFHKYITSRKNIFLLLHAILFATAVFTKETILLFPLMILFYYFFVLKQTFSSKKLLPYFIIWISVTPAYLILRGHIIHNNSNDNILGLKAFVNNLPVIPITVSKFFLPYNLSTFPLFETGAVVTGVLLLIMLIVIALKFTGDQKTWMLFGLLWFFIFTVPGLLSRVKHAEARYLYLEHRTYLIMIGMLIMLASVINYMIRKNLSLLIFSIASVIITIIFSFASFVHADDYADGMSFFDRAIVFNNPSAYTLRGDLYISMHDSADASSDFDKAVQAAPSFPDGYYNRGKFESDIQQDHIAAEKDLTIAISLDSNMSEFHIRRAVQRTKLQDLNGAIDDLNKALLLDSSNAEIYFRFGTIYFQQKKYDQAYQALTKAIKLEPDYSDAYNNRGSLRFTINDFSGAAEDFKKAINVRPGALAYYNLAVVYNNLQLADKAIVYFDSCINLLPNFTPAYIGKGKSMQLKNDLTNACKNWQQALIMGDASAKDTLDKYCK